MSKNYPAYIGKILPLCTFREEDGKTVIDIHKSTPASHPATSASKARLLCDWFSKKYPGTDQENRVLRCPPKTITGDQYATFTLCRWAMEDIKKFQFEQNNHA